MTWPEPVERVAGVLRAAAIEARIEQLPEGPTSAKAAAAAVGCDESQVVQTAVLVCDGAYVLALVPGDRRVDEAAVAAAVGSATVRPAEPGEVEQATGFDPGGVAPFPQQAVAHVVADRSLLAHPLVWIGAGSASHLAALPPGELVRLAGARVFEIAARR